MAALAAVVIVVAFPLVHWRPGRSVELGPLEVTPPAKQLSVRVGESVQFSAGAPGALGFTWTVWGRPVSFASTFSYAPAPEDAGWQQVTVEVGDAEGARLAHTWDVGVIAAIAPELLEVTPPAGTIRLPVGREARFRCGARLPAARLSDRLHFEWSVDGAPALSEEQAAAGGESELVIPLPELGTHRVVVRVTEDGRAAARTDWALEVVAPEPAPEETPPAKEPPQVARKPGPPRDRRRARHAARVRRGRRAGGVARGDSLDTGETTDAE